MVHTLHGVPYSAIGTVAVLDPSDPYVFGPPGSGPGSASQWYGSGSGPFNYQAKIVRKTLIRTVL